MQRIMMVMRGLYFTDYHSRNILNLSENDYHCEDYCWIGDWLSLVW